MTRKILFAAFLLTLALTGLAMGHQLTNAAPNTLPPPKHVEIGQLMSPGAPSSYGVIYVAPGAACGAGYTPCYGNIQAAVDAASYSDLIKVAAGTYTDLHGRPRRDMATAGVVTQVVYISETVAIRGGYTTTNWTTPDSVTNPTTLDAQGKGRVLYVAGSISTTVEGLCIIGGNAAGLHGDPYGNDAGGGVYIITATATIGDNRVFSNTAVSGYGGGLYLLNTTAKVRGNVFLSNTARGGGGVEVDFSPATLSGNTVISNTAIFGGGLYLYYGAPNLVNNVVADNRGTSAGSGIYVLGSSPRLWHTTIARNTGGNGSGLYVSSGSTLVLANTILVSHTVGITVTSGNTVTLNGVLWYGNTVTNTSGPGTISVLNAYTGDPAFAADGYHLTAGSAALNRGVDAGVTTDIDGEPRDAAPDLGADEVRTCRARLNLNPTDYGHVQAAVDASTRLTDVVKVAGYCPGVSLRPRNDITTTGVVTQGVYVIKTLSIQGGYTTTNWDVPYPVTQPTTLDAQGQGRVLYIAGNISPTIVGLRITGGNALGLGVSSWWQEIGGGGVYIFSGTATLRNNVVFSNIAPTAFPYYGYGGGLYLFNSAATLDGNIVMSNTADYGGGGLYLNSSPATLSGNAVMSNLTGVGSGGGLYLNGSDATLAANTISSNTSNSDGGGLYLSSGAATLNGNTIFSNTANYDGGGLYLGGNATLDGNRVSSNAANYSGGGIYLYYGSAALVNTAVTNNRANSSGSGIYVYNALPRLWHTTIARNSGGDGGGVYVSGDYYGYSTVVLTNTILVSQTGGITVTSGNTAILNGVLWYNNGTNTSGSGTITVTQAYTGNPDFAADGYHLTIGSMAIDRGIKAGITTDIDGQSRDAAPDLGADEYRIGPGEARTIVDPNLGGLLIYTDTRGLTTTIQFPPGAVPDTTDVIYTAVPSPTEPVSPGLRLAGLAFDLDAYRNGVLVPSFTFLKTVTITIRYADADVVGIFEDTLRLYRWVPPTWEVVGARFWSEEGQTLDMVNNVLTAWLRGLSHYGEMGTGKNDVYLPIVVRTG